MDYFKRNFQFWVQFKDVREPHGDLELGRVERDLMLSLCLDIDITLTQSCLYTNGQNRWWTWAFRPPCRQSDKMTSREEKPSDDLIGSISCCLSNSVHILRIFGQPFRRNHSFQVGLNLIQSWSLRSKHKLEDQESHLKLFSIFFAVLITNEITSFFFFFNLHQQTKIELLYNYGLWTDQYCSLYILALTCTKALYFFQPDWNHNNDILNLILYSVREKRNLRVHSLQSC